MYRIAICDDDRKYVNFLKRVILTSNVVDKNQLIFCDFYSGESLLLNRAWDFDLIILDVQPGKMDGCEIAMKIREYDRKFLLVFCSETVFPDTRFFKAGAVGYLLKSFSNDRMIGEMTYILNEMKIKKESRYIMCKYSSRKDQIRVYPESILYVGIKNSHSEIFVCGKLKKKYPDNTLRVNMSLNEIATILNKRCGFARAHNSYIINMAYITDKSRNDVQLTDGTKLTISRSRAKAFEREFDEYISAGYRGIFKEEIRWRQKNRFS